MRALPLFIVALLPALVQAAGSVSKAEYFDALTGAMGDLRMRNQTAAGEEMKIEEVAGISDAGTWRVFIVSVCVMQGHDNPTSNN